MTNVRLPRDDRPPKLIYFSMRVGGESSDNAEVIAAVRQLLNARDEFLAPPEWHDLRVDLTFDIPGPFSGPDYHGMRTGSFFRKDGVLVVQAAVPAGLTPGGIPGYLMATLREMVELAKGYVRRRRLPLSTDAIERAAAELGEGILS